MERKDFIKLFSVGAIGMTASPLAHAGLLHKKSDFETCKATWEDLCGKIGTVYKSDGFSYLHPSRKPNVLLYGDSISIQYTSQVRTSLEGVATVTRLFKNGGSSHNFIDNMNELTETMFQPSLEKGWHFKWDVIHFNVGLHDLKYLKGKHLNKNGVQVSSIEVYKDNLDAICKYLKETNPKAKLIFATTTPVPENAKGRFKGDSVKFNNAALEVLANYPDIIINDLYALTLGNQDEWAEAPGNVHYNAIGSTAHGKQVAQHIKDCL